MKILNRFDQSVIFEDDSPSIRETVVAAINANADLTMANLTGVNFTGANLTGANLTRANLTGANLTRADLTRADLTGANLTWAKLTEANLYGAKLTEANLYGADLTRANLTRANLYGANLYGADLDVIKADVWMVLTLARTEAMGLLQSLIAGRIDGSQYEGECCCLVGTIANLRHCGFDAIPGLNPNSSRPSERWFLAINNGDTPENSQVAKITAEWIEEWISLQPDLITANQDFTGDSSPTPGLNDSSGGHFSGGEN